MRFADINEMFTETVRGYIEKGYVFNSATMSGHQGEIAKVDLTDGKEIVRVVLNKGCDVGVVRGFHCSLDVVSLVVGRCSDNVKPNISNGWAIIWNDKLEVISKVDWYQIGNKYWYTTKENAEKQRDVMLDRHLIRYVDDDVVFGDEAKKAVLPFVRRQSGCRTAKISDIEKVYKCLNSWTGKNEYVVEARKRYRFVLK